MFSSLVIGYQMYNSKPVAIFRGAQKPFLGRLSMSTNVKLRAYLYGSVAPILFAAMSLTSTGAVAAPCQGPGALSTSQTKCIPAVQIPGNPLPSLHISWVDPNRAEYYLGHRSNKVIDIIDTQTLTFKRTIREVVGVVLS